MTRTRDKFPPRKKHHTARNLSILILVVAIVLVAVAVSGVLTATTYVVIVHVYDSKWNPQTVYDLNVTMLVANVTVTVSGVSDPTRYTPTGIIGYDQVPAGSYQIQVQGSGYTSNSITYVVGPNCPDRTPDGQCHALVPITRR